MHWKIKKHGQNYAINIETNVFINTNEYSIIVYKRIGYLSFFARCIQYKYFLFYN